MSAAGKIAANPNDLSGEARRLRAAAGEIDAAVRPLVGNLPPMPGPVQAHVEGELGFAMVALSQLAIALNGEGASVDSRGKMFERAGEGGLAIALGGYLTALDQVGGPLTDAFERTLMAPRYVRFGTWVRAYQYVNKYGTVVNVGKHWRNLPNKFMNEKQVFQSIGEDSKFAKAADAAGKAGIALSFAAGGFEEWEQDAGESTPRRVVNSVAVGATTAGGAWAGAESGAMIGGTIGSFVGPEGTVVGGFIGGVGGGIAGSKIGHAVGHFITHLF